VWSDSREDVYKIIKMAAMETLDYMYRNRLAPNASKTQFMTLGKGEKKKIEVGSAEVEESSQVTLLGLSLNRALDWSDHVKKVEKDMAVQTGRLHRRRNFLPRKTLLKTIPGFVWSPDTYSPASVRPQLYYGKVCIHWLCTRRSKKKTQKNPC
jgi:hypothetical protein